jgi:hypothetical protein
MDWVIVVLGVVAFLLVLGLFHTLANGLAKAFSEAAAPSSGDDEPCDNGGCDNCTCRMKNDDH